MDTNNPVKIAADIEQKIYKQDYSAKKTIDGVKLVTLKHFVSEEGDFGEIVRLTKNGDLEAFPEFKLRQINRAMIFPGIVKAWHLHQNQDEIWYVAPSFNLFTGLWDTRENSLTKNVSMRITLGGNISQLLYIPGGVAHGMANFSHLPIHLYYLVSQHFSAENPDELRLHWDALGKDFWKPQRD